MPKKYGFGGGDRDLLNNIRMKRRLYSNGMQAGMLIDQNQMSASPGSASHTFIPRVASLAKLSPKNSESGLSKIEEHKTANAKRERFNDQ